ncbi:unnamed protein product [Clavelina lepadiformis]|uniref:G-protein coupled receptors family 1 profile domain-containing protein n=1 Tax=Clavelina lepadiformis TaxID=159417 RepID=A0ABP0G9G9_CLALP
MENSSGVPTTTEIYAFSPSVTANVIVTSFVVIFMVVGSMGNLLTMVVIMTNKNLRTSSNLFIVSLCTSDFISALVCSPLWLYRRTWGFDVWDWGQFWCKFYWVLDFTTDYTTSLHIVSFAALRFYAVKRPFKVSSITRRKVLVYICCLWILSLGSSLPLIRFMGVDETKGDETIGNKWPSCSIRDNTANDVDEENCCVDQYGLYMAIVSPLFFYTPELCVVLLSALIARALLKRTKWRSNLSSLYDVTSQIQGHERHNQRKHDITNDASNVCEERQNSEGSENRPQMTSFCKHVEPKVELSSKVDEMCPDNGKVPIAKLSLQSSVTHSSSSTKRGQRGRYINGRVRFPSSLLTHRGVARDYSARHSCLELQYQRERKTFTQLSLIVVAYMIGYIPLTVYLLWTTVTGPQSGDQLSTDYWFGVASYLCLRLSECMNPVMYNLGSGNIRASSRRLLRKLLRMESRARH